MSYAVNIEAMFDGQVSLHLPGVARVAMSKSEAVTVGLALLKEAGDADRVEDWLDWFLGQAESLRYVDASVVARTLTGIMEGQLSPREGRDG